MVWTVFEEGFCKVYRRFTQSSLVVEQSSKSFKRSCESFQRIHSLCSFFNRASMLNAGLMEIEGFSRLHRKLTEGS